VEMLGTVEAIQQIQSATLLATTNNQFSSIRTNLNAVKYTLRLTIKRKRGTYWVFCNSRILPCYFSQILLGCLIDNHRFYISCICVNLDLNLSLDSLSTLLTLFFYLKSAFMNPGFILGNQFFDAAVSI
jgi:hypothetical protein